MSSYFRIRLLNVSSSKEEEVTQFCFEYEATGISEALAYSQPDLTYDPDILPTRNHNLDVFFLKQPPLPFFEGLSSLQSSIKWEVIEEEEKDWLAEWKKGFIPFQLVGPFWVVPSWCPSPTDPVHTISIDPGMAFGTGTHATTKMASYFVHKVCSQPGREEKSMVDVGTGTGILSILAKRHGVGQVTGIEIDPEARRVARENIAHNDVNIEIPETLLEEIDKKFDIVVANIIDGVLIQIKPLLLHLLRPNGDLFLTGILLEREEHFFSHFIESSNLNIVRRIEQDEWVGYWLKA
jgi:ribosomal protein L11 methyltransferase